VTPGPRPARGRFRFEADREVGGLLAVYLVRVGADHSDRIIEIVLPAIPSRVNSA